MIVNLMKLSHSFQNHDLWKHYKKNLFILHYSLTHLDYLFTHSLTRCVHSQVVLSLLLELPHTEDTADILAEHMYDFENLHPEVQERLERTLTSWQVGKQF